MQSPAEFRAYHRQISLVRTMFLHTADENYIGARSAFSERRDYDFWWLTLHAVEKYLKAILLMNGQSANATNHNLNTLMGRVKRLDNRLVPPPFVRPKILGRRHFLEDDGDFVKRLNTFGQPANRYASYSYTITDADIMQADWLIYWARRHARVLRGGANPEIDWVDELVRSPGLWVHHDGSPLEKLADSDLKSATAKAFVRGNIAFFPKRRHQPLPRRGPFIRNGPFFQLLQSLKGSAEGSEQRLEARLVLQWALKNIYLPKDDVEHLTGLLGEYP